MAGTFDAGSVIYEVDMDTSRLLAARREVDAALNGLNGSMGRLEASVNRTERSIGSMERTMSSLSGVAKGLLAALSVQQVASYADAWTELNNKVANSVRTGETQAEVMQRIFDVSQATQSSLNGTATLYARLERGTRTYNTSAEDLTRLTTIINQGFAVSGATAQEAENAIIQLSQGIASGVLRGEEFNSVSEQGSRLMVALADSMGVSIGQLRAMAAQGQLTTDVVVKGLLSQGDAIGKEFANTTVSIAKGLQVAGNNVTKFFGENSTVKSFAAGFRDSVITISENLETLSGALIIVAGIMGSRYVGALTMATAAKISDIAASRQQLIAENQQAQSALVAANSAQRKALADKEAALSSLALAQAEYNVAKGSAAEMLALDALIAAETRATMASATYAEAKLAQAAASNTAAAAARAASVGVGLAGKALSLIGGPAGAAMLAAGAIFYFWQKAQQAREEAIRFADGLDEVNASMKAMNNTQLRGTIADTNKSIQAQEENIRDLEDSIKKLQGEIDDYTARGKQFGTTIEQGNGLLKIASDKTDELNQKSRDLANAQDKLARTQDTAAEANRTLNNNMLTAMGVHEQLIQKGWSLEQVQGAVAKAFGLTADEINRANQAGQNFNPKALQISPPTEEGDKNILNLKEQNELLKIRDERTRAVRKAEMEQAKVTKNKNQIEEQGRLAGENFDLKKAEEERQEAQRKSEQQDKRSATAAESVAQKLEQLRQESVLAADSTEGLTREQQLLRAEQSLGAHATDEQKKKARDYKAAALDAAAAAKGVSEALRAMPEQAENKSYADSMQNLKAALNAGKIDQQEYNAATEQMEQQHQANLAKIRAQQTVSPMQEARGQIDPVQQLANQHAQELALIQQFESQKGQITQRGLELMNAANTQYEQQRIAAQWEIWRQQNAGYEVAAAAFDSFAGNASNALTGIITGSMSVSEAMRSLGSTVLNSVINSFVQMGVEWLKSVIMGQAGMTAASGMAIAQGQLIAASMAPAAAMTSLATAGANAIPAQAGIASTVGMAQALSIAGARYNGGPVSAGGLYQVGEKGKPEIYQASTGKQYMIPGDNGKVISNKDMQGGGGLNVQVVINNQASNAEPQYMGATQNDGNYVLEFLISDAERNGPYISTLQSTLGLSRKANGAF
ncbi:tape measure protein [Klebsiella pneumoniae]|uniref:tape measure protein n=1 Tax=Klebsiella pneumoniae TaxID=573 RepID=UPI002380CAD7|nr:tape measure protein [Klebsiella pneumoniae]MDE4670924.1 tape measure protein [Klebsiella pneumoniae]